MMDEDMFVKDINEETVGDVLYTAGSRTSCIDSD